MKYETKMAQLNVEIPEDLKRAIKSTAAKVGVSMQAWTIAALREASAGKSVVLNNAAPSFLNDAGKASGKGGPSEAELESLKRELTEEKPVSYRKSSPRVSAPKPRAK